MSTEIVIVRFINGSKEEFDKLSYPKNVLYIMDDVIERNLGITSYLRPNSIKIFYFNNWTSFYSSAPTTKQKVIELWDERTIAITYCKSKEDWAQFINSIVVECNGAQLE